MPTKAMWVYNLYYHDDTADPNRSSPPADDPNCADAAQHSGWCLSPYPMVAAGGVTMQYLKPFHRYSFQVLAGGWRADDQTPSRIVAATAYVARPSHAPTLTSAVAPNESFTWILPPLAQYTFYVVENNQAGDGPLSNGITAVPGMCGLSPAPPCPTGHRAAPRRAAPAAPVLVTPDGRPVTGTAHPRVPRRR